MLIADWLAFWRRCEPQRQALFDVARQRSYSYAQLADAADLCALQLQALGLQQGERIALLAANCPQTLMLLFACARLGVVLVPLNYGLTPAALSEGGGGGVSAVIVSVVGRSTRSAAARSPQDGPRPGSPRRGSARSSRRPRRPPALRRSRRPV